MVSVNPWKLDFPHIRQVAELTRERIVFSTGKSTTETTYLIISMKSSQAAAAEVLRIKREYWFIENKLHYRKDFVFGEDRQTARVRSGPRVLSALRNLAVSIYNFFGVENVKRCVDCIKRQPLLLVQAVCW